jgi:hypothetical protein
VEDFLDALLQFLITYVAPKMPSATAFILGDPGTSAPTSLPFVYLVPLFDAVKPLSNGVDMDTYVVPMLVVDDMHQYGPPVQNANVSSPQALEQPGYRKLMQYGQTFRDELRAGGQAITQDGIAATSTVPAISYVWVKIDNKQYRGVRIALQVEQRRPRQAAP